MLFSFKTVNIQRYMVKNIDNNHEVSLITFYQYVYVENPHIYIRQSDLIDL